MSVDPLESIQELPIETQVAVVISVLRSTRNTLNRVERKVDWVIRSIWTLIATIVAGLVIFVVTSGHHPQTTKPGAAVPQVARVAP